MYFYLFIFKVPGDTPVSEAKQNLNLDAESIERSEMDIKIEYEVPSLSPHKDSATSAPIVSEVFTNELGDKVPADHLPSIQTAVVQECNEMDTVSIIPTEKVITAVATEVTLTEDDVGKILY